MKAPIAHVTAALWLVSCSASPEGLAGRYLGPEMPNGQDHLQLTADGHYRQTFYLIDGVEPVAVNQGTWAAEVWPSGIRLHKPMFVNDMTPEKVVRKQDLRLRLGQCGAQRCLKGLGPDVGYDYRLQAESGAR